MILRSFLLIIVMAVLLVSCSDDSGNPAGSSQLLRVVPASRSVGNSVDSTSFDIIASGAWTLSESAEWIWVQPTSGIGNSKVIVHFDSHSGNARSCDITINAPGHVPETVTAKLIQSANPALKVNPSSVTIADTENTVYFSITASGEWETIETLDWLSAYPVIGDGSGQLAVTVSKNPGNSRTGVITITAPNHFPTALTVNITQNPKPMELRVIPAQRTEAYDSIVTGFSVIAGGGWSVSTIADWIILDPMYGSGDGYFRLNYSENTGLERIAKITVQAPGHRPERLEVTFTQEGSPTARPIPPENLRAIEVYWDEVHLDWSDVSDNELGFIIERRDGLAGQWGEINRVGSGLSYYSDILLTPQFEYHYRVFGYNAFGRSESSAGVVVRTHTPPVNILVNGSAEGNIDPAKDRDWYILQVTELASRTIKVSLNDLASASLWVYGPNDKSRLRYSDENESGDPEISESLPPGTYYLKVGPKNEDCIGSYSIEVK